MNHHPVATYRYIPGPIDMTAPLITTPLRAAGRSGITMIGGLILATGGLIIVGVFALIIAVVLIAATALFLLATAAIITLFIYAIVCGVRGVHCRIGARRAMMVPTEPDNQE